MRKSLCKKRETIKWQHLYVIIIALFYRCHTVYTTPLVVIRESEITENNIFFLHRISSDSLLFLSCICACIYMLVTFLITLPPLERRYTYENERVRENKMSSRHEKANLKSLPQIMKCK